MDARLMREWSQDELTHWSTVQRGLASG